MYGTNTSNLYWLPKRSHWNPLWKFIHLVFWLKVEMHWKNCTEDCGKASQYLQCTNAQKSFRPWVFSSREGHEIKFRILKDIWNLPWDSTTLHSCWKVFCFNSWKVFCFNSWKEAEECMVVLSDLTNDRNYGTWNTFFSRHKNNRDFTYCRRMLFSDESKLIGLSRNDGRQCVLRRKDEEFKPRCTFLTLQSSGGSVMVRDVIYSHGLGSYLD